MIIEREQTIRDIKNSDELKKAYKEYLMQKIRKSEDDLRNGRVLTMEQLKNFIDGLEAEYEAENI